MTIRTIHVKPEIETQLQAAITAHTDSASSLVQKCGFKPYVPQESEIVDTEDSESVPIFCGGLRQDSSSVPMRPAAPLGHRFPSSIMRSPCSFKQTQGQAEWVIGWITTQRVDGIDHHHCLDECDRGCCIWMSNSHIITQWRMIHPEHMMIGISSMETSPGRAQL